MKFLNTKIFALAVLLLIIGKINNIKAQEISPYLIGNNAWYDGASLNSLWDDMALAKFQTIRIGGAAAEGYAPNNSKYLTLINGVRSANAEPILQVPRYFTDQQVKDFITAINVTNGKNIKLWSIGNEPDHTNRPSTVAEVSAYTKRISSALKSVDSTIIVMGPETSWYQNSAYMTPLIGGSYDITGKDAASNYYIDVVTFHKYMFTEISGLESDVNNLLTKFNTVNAKRPAGKKLSWGLTEFNTSYDNDVNTSPDMDVWSFHAGQLFAEVYGLGMRKGAFSINSWSMFEGPDRSGTDLSLFDKDLKGRANYYHCLMFGQNMKKNSITTNDNKGNVVVIPMADSSGVAVMILNKDHTNSFEYTLRLDNSAYVQPKTLQIKVNAGINTEIIGNIATEATQMLVFDAAGTLVKRYTYTSRDADGRGEPLVEYITTDSVPLVTLTQPTGETKISLKSSLLLTAEATDNGTIQKVEFTANGALIGKSVTAPYSYQWTPTNPGTYEIAARAYDELGGVGFSTSKTVVVEKVFNYIPVPATIEAEAFDEMMGIQLEPTTDTGGGQNIGYCDAGDWMDYTINVPNDGQYNVEMRVASLNKTGAFSLKNGSTVLASFALPNGTGGWQNWTTLSKTINMKAGNQTLRLAITGKDININWMRISNLTSTSSQKLNQVEIFPNPASRDHFSLKLTGLTEIEPVDIKIYSISGNTVYSQKALLAKNGTAEIVVQDKKSLDSGVYIVSVQSKSLKINRKLILKD
jgi:hypothetical protein